MAFLKNKWAVFSMLVVIWALLSSFFAAYYYMQYNDVSTRVAGAVIFVNVGVDYGNGTRAFSNDTKTITGATLFDVTKRTFNVTYQVGLYGTEITSINNVAKAGNYGWTYWVWNATGSSWDIVWENADGHKVADKETYMWYYQNGFTPPP